MNSPGEGDDAPQDDLLVRSRSAMLDALQALAEHRDAVIVIGAQAVYLRTGSADVALAEATKDSDLAMDTRTLGEDPLVEVAMRAAGFMPDPVHSQPGTWINNMGYRSTSWSQKLLRVPVAHRAAALGYHHTIATPCAAPEVWRQPLWTTPSSVCRLLTRPTTASSKQELPGQPHCS